VPEGLIESHPAVDRMRAALAAAVVHAGTMVEVA
jgi:hypothetical protein